MNYGVSVFLDLRSCEQFKFADDYILLFMPPKEAYISYKIVLYLMVGNVEGELSRVVMRKNFQSIHRKLN